MKGDGSARVAGIDHMGQGLSHWARKMLFAAILSICASSLKKISIYNEEMIVARCFIGFIIFSRKSLVTTFKETLNGRIRVGPEFLDALGEAIKECPL
nr:ATP synthase subunit 4, mitochondrial [Tanacetum cinerariifolium]